MSLFYVNARQSLGKDTLIALFFFRFVAVGNLWRTVGCICKFDFPSLVVYEVVYEVLSLHLRFALFRLFLLFALSLKQKGDIVHGSVRWCRLALRSGIGSLVFLFGDCVEELVDKGYRAVFIVACMIFLLRGALGVAQLVMCSLNEFEDYLAVGEIDRCLSQFFVKRRTVQYIQVLQHQ